MAAAIKLDSPGPALFRQRRPGKGTSTFELVKFRTMQHAHRSLITVTEVDDPRITRIGRLLRRTHLDELPQLWNILRGDMSFIGPRPEPMPNHMQYAAAIEHFHDRRRILPGLTGLAQTQLGYTVDIRGAEEKLKYDLEYIEGASPALDAKIVVATVREMVRPRRSW